MYKTYKYYVDKWSDADESGESKDQESFAHYQRNQQRSKAKATKESISDMREVSSPYIQDSFWSLLTSSLLQIIRQAFRSSEVKSLRFLWQQYVHALRGLYSAHTT